MALPCGILRAVQRMSNSPGPPAAPTDEFDAVIFSGGGCRCFWQLGFWTVAGTMPGLRPRWVGAASAGAGFACAALAGIGDEVVRDFKRRARDNARNIYPLALLRRQRPFPHEAMYRATILANLDQTLLSRLHEGPDIRVLLARPLRWLGARGGLAAAALALGLERWSGRRGPQRVHAVWGRRLGFRGEVVSIRHCATPAQLADLILQTSCTPPITPLYRRDERIVLDGGLVDNAPLEAIGDARSTLVLLTRAFDPAVLSQRPGCTYLTPSHAIPIQAWDYTSPDLVQQTYDLGRRDGEAFARRALA